MLPSSSAPPQQPSSSLDSFGELQINDQEMDSTPQTQVAPQATQLLQETPQQKERQGCFV
ncbi:hypothetical protein CRE_24173 [Caenorhabditis remanei]|uniref:Uncharacterized protein n=1 Tax=Caenorhabditis remanei TaxID=31234 RepID=E3N972_CAERE|nr:hypothetical protein CRE_24173 [Caenorhabditis remanei]